MGCERVEITDEKLINDKNQLVYVVLNESTADASCLKTYYNSIKAMLKNNVNVFIVMVAETSKIRGSICNLMQLFGNYNVYQVPDENFISSAYLDTLPERTVTYDEMAQYLQNDIVAYDDMDTVLQGVQECINRNDAEGLKTLIEGHLPTIEAAPTVFSQMKNSIDQANSGVLQDKIANIKAQLEEANELNEKKQTEIRQRESTIDDLNSSLKDARRQLTQTKADMEELKLQVQNAGPAIRSYQTVKTQLLKCKTEHIIYIKEISRIPYINSFVLMLQEMIKQFRYTSKLLIYDNTSQAQVTYGNMQQVDSAAFESNKAVLLNKTPKFVVTEPAPQILKDILQSINPQFDVLIVYDRMKQATDLVEGNNVYKFWVVNSFNDYNTTKNLFKIDRTDTIITRPASRIAPDVIDIPRIKAYEAETQDNGKFAKYKGVQTTICKQPLMPHFLKICNISRKTS